MALYKHAQHLQKSDALAFDAVLTPGMHANHPGVYRCNGCGDEVPIARGQPMPAHLHAFNHEEVAWQLLVYAVAKG